LTNRWIASWTASPMNVWAPDAPLAGIYGQTIREFSRLSLGGSRIALRFTNEFGTTPLVFDEVEVAVGGVGGRIIASTRKEVTFGGSRAGTVHPGSPLLSDPIDISMPALSLLAVSYFSSGFMPFHTHHFEAQQTAYVSVPGNFMGSDLMVAQNVTTSHYALSSVLVEAPSIARAIICFGDSITDGFGSSIDTSSRWPDLLAERLAATPGFENVAVLNQGIGGNRLLNDRRGVKALARFDRDVLAHTGATHLILLEGINDIVWPKTVLAGPEEVVTGAEMIAGIQQLIARARMAGLKVILGTLMPFEGTRPDLPHGGYYTADKEKVRQAVNRWIRTESGADGLLDFDEVVRDPSRPSRLRPDFDCGDHIHPNDRGYRAMADSIPLDIIKTKSE
jgi:lysophospholipase L1-like esterase